MKRVRDVFETQSSNMFESQKMTVVNGTFTVDTVCSLSIGKLKRSLNCQPSAIRIQLVSGSSS